MLTDTMLRNLKPRDKQYKVTDRDGLYVAVSVTGAISFRYNYRLNGRSETLTFGRYGVPPSSIARFKARERPLGPDEIRLLYQYLNRVATTPVIRLAVKLLLLTMVRKFELSKATLNQVTKLVWTSAQADGQDLPQFSPHDFRRTASTLLNEAGYNSDWIEKCLAHEQRGVRSVYNKAEYAEGRREMLQDWANRIDGWTQNPAGA